MPSKKRKYNARFPAGRIKKIMQTDEEVGKVAQAVPVIISRTLELFVESLITKAMEITNAKNAKTLSPSHMKQCILSESRFDFLKDLVKNIPDINNEECGEGNVSINATPQLISQPPPLAPISDYSSKVTQKPHCSNFAKETSTISTTEQRWNNATDIQMETSINNTNYSANFYAEQTTSTKLSTINYQQIDSTQIDHHTDSKSLNGPSIFHISSKISDDKNDQIPPLIPIPQFSVENKLYNNCSPNDNNLSIDEDYDN